MTIGTVPQNSPVRRTRRFNIPTRFAYLIPLPVGALVMLLSLLIGADAGYVFFQFLLFALAVPLLYLLKTDLYATSILIASYCKIFYISQFVAIFFLYPPDAALNHPYLTLIGMSCGLVAGMLGILLARLVVSAAPRGTPVLAINITPERLRRLGYWTALVGLPSQAIWDYNISRLRTEDFGGIGQTTTGVAVFSYLCHLSILAFCCFAAEELIVTKGRTFLSRRFIITVALYYVLIAPLGAKTEPLLPLVAVFATVIVFKWKPQPVPLIAGALMLLFVAQVLFPVINYSRTLTFGERRSLPVVFAETLGETLTDPSKFAQIKSFSKTMQLHWTEGDPYFGQPAGFLDRFTPLRTDKLVTGAQYAKPIGVKVFANAATSILPQTFGFKRDITGPQRMVEAALFRHLDSNGDVFWENSGYIGDGFINGGLGMASLFVFLFGFGSSLLGRMTFGATRTNVFWVPFLVEFMFAVADWDFAGTPPLYVWAWLIQTGVIWGILQWMSRNDPGLLVKTR